MSLKGRTAIVTGSAGSADGTAGVGRSVALKLGSLGCNVVVNYGTNRRGKQVAAQAQRVAKAIETLGGQALVCPADIRDPQQVERMVREAVKRFRRVDILVNNAGGGWEPRDLAAVSPDYWDSCLRAEADGAFWAIRQLLPGMRRRRWGRIVNLGYTDSLLRNSLADDDVPYTLGKAARTWLSRVLRDEVKNGVTVNAVEITLVEHIAFDQALALLQGKRAGFPSTRLTPYDVAEVVAWLCSEQARFVSGAVIPLPCQNLAND